MKDISAKIKDKKFDIIECPICKAQYLPAEIYIPNNFVGKPLYINKDHMTAAIEDFSGASMDKVEHYICDHCNTPFKIIAKVNFTTIPEPEIDFSKEYSTSLKKQSLFLSEV